METVLIIKVSWGEKKKPTLNYNGIKLGINPELFFSNLFLTFIQLGIDDPLDNDYFIIRKILNILLFTLIELGDPFTIHYVLSQMGCVTGKKRKTNKKKVNGDFKS